MGEYAHPLMQSSVGCSDGICMDVALLRMHNACRGVYFSSSSNPTSRAFKISLLAVRWVIPRTLATR